MSKVGQMVQEIQELVYAGVPNETIATQLGAPLSWVEDIADNLFAEMNDYDGQPDEAQEWHDFDPDC